MNLKKHNKKRLSRYIKSINRKVRKEFTQGAQSAQRINGYIIDFV